MKKVMTSLLLLWACFAVSQASIFSSTINPSELVGQYQCHGDDVFFHTKYIGSFTLVPDQHDHDLLIYQARYDNDLPGEQLVHGLAYIDHDTLILAFKPSGTIPPGVANYRVSGGGKFLKGKFVYLTDPGNAAVNQESCNRIQR